MNESIAKFVGGVIGVGGGGCFGWAVVVGGRGAFLLVRRSGHFYWYAARDFKKLPAIYWDFDFFSPKTPGFENSS